MNDVQVKGNYLYCEKHKGWFYSTLFAKSGEFPVQCSQCKRYFWNVPNKVKK